MALPASGDLSIGAAAGAGSSIQYEVDGNYTKPRKLSEIITATDPPLSGSYPHKMSEYYGFDQGVWGRAYSEVSVISISPWLQRNTETSQYQFPGSEHLEFTGDRNESIDILNEDKSDIESTDGIDLRIYYRAGGSSDAWVLLVTHTDYDTVDDRAIYAFNEYDYKFNIGSW